MPDELPGRPEPIESISALTLATAAMAPAVRFYEALGFVRLHGGPEAAFTSFGVGLGYVNLQLVDEPPATGWGRAVLHVADVDATHDRAVAAGYRPEMAPSDAPWGERYFHLRDPSGHELSFARPR